MNSGPVPVLKDLVLIGGGHSHVSVIKGFAMAPMPGVRLTVVSRDAHAPYSGMLPGLIAGHYTFDEAHIDLGPLCRLAGARFLHDEVVGIDPERKTISFGERPPVPFDVLSINIGSTPGLRVPGAAGSVVPAKPIDGFWRRWELLRDRCLARREETRIGVVGGGAGGVELLLAVRHRLRTLLREQNRSADYLRFYLTTLTDDILPTHNSRVRAKFRRVLDERGVEFLPGHRVIEVESDAAAERSYRLQFEDGESLDLDEVLWVTSARAADWPGDSGLDVDDRGFIKVRDTLQTLSFDDVFAAGDVADVVDHPRPKAGVFAVRQGPPLAENLRLRLLGEAPVPFVPQSKFLSLVSTGDKYAVASRGEWAAEGAWLWRWKDHIDRQFMDKFNKLPPAHEMEGIDDEPLDARLLSGGAAAELALGGHSDLRHLPPGATPTDRALDAISVLAMRCGGCGSKVGSSVLGRVLNQLEPVRRDDVVVGLDAADDAAVVTVPAGKQVVQTIDYFRAFIEDPYVFGQVAANHALGDVFAMAAEPQTALAHVTIPYGLEAKVEADLLHMLSGALAVLNRENTALVGGHTSEGAELGLGFAVNGLVDAGAAIGKGGLRPGDALVITKPLGTGALFAADMRMAAKGRWIEGALQSMLLSNRAAAHCLVEHGSQAITDVTGFGLLGHLVEMTKASQVDAELRLDAVPALEGVVDVMGQGIVSSLHAENVRLRRAITNLDDAVSHPFYALIFDPQTAGGLLAGVPGENVEACVTSLRRLGYVSAQAIGTIGEAGGSEAPVRLVI